LTSIDKAAIVWSVGIVAVFIGIAFAVQGIDNSPSQVSIANPSATYCIENGGEYDLDGTCTLSDGTQCDAWEYFRGECPAEPISEWGYRAIDLNDSDAPMRGGDFGFGEELFSSKARLAISDEIIMRPVAPTEEKDIRIYGTVDDLTIPNVTLLITTPTGKTFEKTLSVDDSGNFAVDVPVKSTTPLGEYSVSVTAGDSSLGEVTVIVKERVIIDDVIHDRSATTDSIILNTDDVTIPSSYANTQTLHITGTIADYTRGNPVAIVIVWPDGTEDKLTTRATSHGFFDTFYTINPEHIEGIYDIILKYNLSEIARTTLTIGTPTISFG